MGGNFLHAYNQKSTTPLLKNNSIVDFKNEKHFKLERQV